MLAEFTRSPQKNEWLLMDHMNVYVRKGRHMFSGELIETFDIANIKVEDDYQDSGIFTAFLEEAESLGLPVYIENVLTERFANFFKKREGYVVVYEDHDMWSFLRREKC